MPIPNDNRVTYLARVDYRNDRRVFGIRRRDRRSHVYLVGKTGTGKSTLLANMIRQDIQAGEGLAVLDPHGELAEQALQSVPAWRKPDLIHFNVPDRNLPLGFNPLHRVPPDQRALAASDLIDVFKKIWADSWGPRLEHILRNALLAILHQPEPTLLDVLRLLNDREFRREITLHLPNKQVREFWLREYEGYPVRFRAEAIAPIQNKVGAFLSNPLLCRILTAQDSTFDLRLVMDEGKVLIANLAKGKIGEDTATLLGAFLVARLGRTALRRADTPEHRRRDFYVYLDEFQSFSTLSLANMLSELRKYRLNLTLAHQFLNQLAEEVRDAVLGNVGTTIAFRLGLADAELLEKEFYPEFSATDLINLPNYHVYLKLMVDGVVTKPFSAMTLRNP
jgi:energy-coupling factor transporter ATP-binding protein EcfA2